MYFLKVADFELDPSNQLWRIISMDEFIEYEGKHGHGFMSADELQQLILGMASKADVY